MFTKTCGGLGINPILTQISVWWKPGEFDKVPYKVAVISSFIAYMMTAKNLVCRTMETFLSGVEHKLRISRIDMSFWDHTQSH